MIKSNNHRRLIFYVRKDLKNRGVRDVMVICADGLSGIKEAIQSPSV